MTTHNYLLTFILATFTAYGLQCETQAAASPTIKLDQSIVYVDKNADAVKQFAAQELKKHLSLITEKDIALVNTQPEPSDKHFIFSVGNAPAGKDISTLKPEEARYTLNREKNILYLYGSDKIIMKKGSLKEINTSFRNWVGTLFSVYDFLHRELGVRWIKPGNDGICYRTTKRLRIKSPNHQWSSDMIFRGFRSEAWRSYKIEDHESRAPKAFHVSPQYALNRRAEELLWQRRMKMGQIVGVSYGHAFTKYWQKYGKAHPEWFALGKNGKRGVHSGQHADRLKLCVSNPELLDTIANEWKAKWERNKSYNIYNACPNDSRGYCRCKKCRALDVTLKSDKGLAGLDGEDHLGIVKKQKKGETFETNPKTDRYVYFWNELLKRAKKFNPKARLIVYIYSDYRYAPRQRKLSEGIICGFVPRFRDSIISTDKKWTQWKKMGLKEVFLRPNDYNDEAGMPMGNGKLIFDKFALSRKHALKGSDYDRAYNASERELYGLADYALARAHFEPSKSFEDLEDEFASTFGAAKNDVKAFYRYWITVFEKKRLAHIGKAGGFEGRRYLRNHLKEFYEEKDFGNARAFLNNALKKTLPKRIKKNINSILLSLEHSRLTFLAISANRSNTPLSIKRKTANALYDFRLANKSKLSPALSMLFSMEIQLNDAAGIKRFVTNAPKGEYISLSYDWKFKIDDKKKGLNENWQKTSWQAIKKQWHNISISSAWEKQASYPNKVIAKKLKAYNGIGWYALEMQKRPDLKGKKVRLNFGAVDEACWIYLDGKKLGEHLYLKPDDWKTSFSFPLNNDDLATKDQLIIVRVEDNGGAGGIWQEVSLYVED